jgi:ribonuclease VapC
MVLDASALLALVNAEPGAEIVAAALGEATIGAVNLAEVVTKLIDIGVPASEAWSETANLVPTIVDFGPELANVTARLRTTTRRRGLSLGDRACLALAESLGQPVLTTDRAWHDLSIGVEVCLIR